MVNIIPIPLVHIYMHQKNRYHVHHIELKVEHNGSHATFINEDISIEKNSFIRCLTKGKPLTFILLECHQLQIKHHPSLIIVLIRQNWVRMGQHCYLIFFPAAENQMINQAGSRHLLLKQIKKTFNRYPKAFQKYHIIASGIVSNIGAT